MILISVIFVQVVIGADYPTCAPEFRIRVLSGMKPQPVSEGGGNSQSDLRSIESEVSSHPPLSIFIVLIDRSSTAFSSI